MSDLHEDTQMHLLNTVIAPHQPGYELQSLLLSYILAMHFMLVKHLKPFHHMHSDNGDDALGNLELL